MPPMSVQDGNIPACDRNLYTLTILDCRKESPIDYTNALGEPCTPGEESPVNSLPCPSRDDTTVEILKALEQPVSDAALYPVAPVINITDHVGQQSYQMVERDKE